jgi:hypothetical protein
MTVPVDEPVELLGVDPMGPLDFAVWMVSTVKGSWENTQSTSSIAVFWLLRG